MNYSKTNAIPTISQWAKEKAYHKMVYDFEGKVKVMVLYCTIKEAKEHAEILGLRIVD